MITTSFCVPYFFSFSFPTSMIDTRNSGNLLSCLVYGIGIIACFFGYVHFFSTALLSFFTTERQDKIRQPGPVRKIMPTCLLQRWKSSCANMQYEHIFFFSVSSCLPVRTYHHARSPQTTVKITFSLFLPLLFLLTFVTSSLLV